MGVHVKTGSPGAMAFHAVRPPALLVAGSAAGNLDPGPVSVFLSPPGGVVRAGILPVAAQAPAEVTALAFVLRVAFLAQSGVLPRLQGMSGKIISPMDEMAAYQFGIFRAGFQHLALIMALGAILFPVALGA